MRSSRGRRGAARGAGRALGLVLAAGFAGAGAAPATQCQAGETAYFSCTVGAKTASLCGRGQAAALQALTYRYGPAGKVELEFTARADNSQRFYATVSPLSPGASVSQVWFDRGELRYLLTECSGGNCAKNAGLAVLRGDRVLMNATCSSTAAGDLAFFSPELVRFGSGAADSRSASELLRIEDADNGLDLIYRRPPAR